MKRYLVIASAASSIPALVARARELSAAASGVSFVLVTPRPDDVADDEVAQHLATANEVLAVAQLRRARLLVEDTAIGDSAPLYAIEDELRAHPGDYDAVVLASPVPRRSARLLGRDDHWRADSLRVPVMHVYEGSTAGLPRPLSQHIRRVTGVPAAFFALIGRTLKRPRLGLALMMLPVLAYLSVGAGLAIFISRGFIITELVAASLYTAMIVTVVVLERTESRPNDIGDTTDEERASLRGGRGR